MRKKSVLCTLLASPKLLSLGIVKVNFFSAHAYSQLSLYSFLCSLHSAVGTVEASPCGSALMRLSTFDLIAVRIDKQNACIGIVALQLHEYMVE